MLVFLYLSRCRNKTTRKRNQHLKTVNSIRETKRTNHQSSFSQDSRMLSVKNVPNTVHDKIWIKTTIDGVICRVELKVQTVLFAIVWTNIVCHLVTMVATRRTTRLQLLPNATIPLSYSKQTDIKTTHRGRPIHPP